MTDEAAVSGEASTEVIVQLRPDVARALRGQAPASAESRAIVAVLGEHGVALEPVHVSAVEPAAASYFRLEVPDLQAAETVIAALRAVDAVEAAYPKPRASPP
jgi:hypothetical protein